MDAPSDESALINEWRPQSRANEADDEERDARADDGADAWPAFLRELSPSLAPSLLGTIVTRVPGRDATRVNARFGRVHISAKLESGFAYTEVEEELVNDTDAQLEAIVSFRAPAGGVISRMALWVEDRLVEAEVVERQRAKDVYTGIVERSRDPALLEQDPSGFVELRVFPVPAHGARRVVVGYVQALERREGHYRFELGLQLPDGAPPIRELSAHVELAGVAAEQLSLPTEQPAPTVERGAKATHLRWSGSNLRPLAWGVSFVAPEEPLTTFIPARAQGAERFVALRVTPDLPATLSLRDASVWLIDNSAGQAGAALDASKAVVAKLLKQLAPGERFAIVACDTACSSYPGRGVASASADSRRDARRFVAGLTAQGASDIGNALFEALQHTRGREHAQLVYFGDARPTAGDLRADEMVQRLVGRGERLDLRLVGVGTALDTTSLSQLAARLTAARLVLGPDRHGVDVEHVVRWLAQPILRSPRVGLPTVLESAYPRQLPNLVRGDEQLVLARLGRRPSGTLHGQLDGVFDDGAGLAQRRSELGFELPRRELRADSVPRLWAHARLRELDDDEGAAAYRDSVELSKRYQVLSRHTSFLALENDAMFRTFGVQQRFGRADFGLTPVSPLPVRAVRSQAKRYVGAPVIRMATTTVSGRLPPEAIRETVRRNDGRFRACYHDGLLRNPKLEGTVTTRFVIGRDGAVAASTDSGSTLTDRAVVACIVRTFTTLVFPPPDGAVIIVVYPFALSPSTAREQRTLPTPWTSRKEPPLAVLAPAPVPLASEASAPAARTTAAELAMQVEQDPSDVALQLATAQAYEAEHGEQRACAHFRAAATLAPRDMDAQYQALRCRARVLHERVSVLADVARLDLHSPAIDALTAQIRSLSPIPRFTPTR